jgi:hypothetical protein
MTDIDEFLAILAQGPRDRTCVFNPWRDWDDRDRQPRREMPKLRRENMRTRSRSASEAPP